MSQKLGTKPKVVIHVDEGITSRYLDYSSLLSGDEGKLFVRLPSKSSICGDEAYDWCSWVLEYDGKVIPQNTLEQLGLLKRMGNKIYAHRDIVDKLRLYMIDNIGSRRHPEYVVKKIFDVKGNVLYESKNVYEDEEARKLYDKTVESLKLWDTALKSIEYNYVKIPEPSYEKYPEMYKKGFRIDMGDVSVEFEERKRYGVVKIYAPKALKEIIEKQLAPVLAKYGFVKGQYGGYIIRGKVGDIDQLGKELINELKKMSHVIEKEVNRELYEKYLVRKDVIEKARKELGIPITDPGKPITREIVLKTISTSMEKPEKKEEEEISLEEALEGWFTPPKSLTAVKPEEKREEKEEEELGEVREAVKRVTPEDIARAMAGLGYKRVRLVVFDLPTEFKGAETVYSKEGGKYVEKKIFSVDPAKYRTLRKKFYTILHRIAYRTPSGWVMFENPSKTDLDELNAVIKALNDLAGTKRTVWIIETYMPRKELVEWLRTYIAQRKANLAEIKRKLEENIEKKTIAKRLRKQFNQLIEEIQRLEQELKYL